jgi:hypothetical protein
MLITRPPGQPCNAFCNLTRSIRSYFLVRSRGSHEKLSEWSVDNLFHYYSYSEQFDPLSFLVILFRTSLCSFENCVAILEFKFLQFLRYCSLIRVWNGFPLPILHSSFGTSTGCCIWNPSNLLDPGRSRAAPWSLLGDGMPSWHFFQRSSCEIKLA